jgi:hypothetical protein
MLSKLLVFLGLTLVVFAVGLSLWSRASSAPFIQEGQEAIIGIPGFIMAFIGAIGWFLNGLSDSAKSVAKYAASPEGKRALRKARKTIAAMEKKNKDPLNIRND